MNKIEKKLIGSLMVFPEKIKWVETNLQMDWLSPFGCEIYKAILKYYKENKEADFSLVFNYFERLGKRNIASLVVDCFEEADASGVFIESACKELMKNNIESQKQLILRQRNKEISEIRDELGKIEENYFSGVEEFPLDLEKTMFQISDSIGKGIELPTGISKLDNLIGGLTRGELFVVGGATSMGKSAFALSVIVGLLKRGKRILFNSLEMSKSVVTRRLLVMESGARLFPLNKITKEDERKVSIVAGEVQKYHLKILEGEYSLDNLRSAISFYEPSVVVIDYLQLFPTKNAETRNLAVGENARKLKLFAEEYNVAMLVLSQLRRGSSSATKRPSLDDLRESGEIEQNADMVGFLYRKGLFLSDVSNEITEFIIAKNRNGLIGTIPLKFVGERMRFYSVTE